MASRDSWDFFVDARRRGVHRIAMSTSERTSTSTPKTEVPNEKLNISGKVKSKGWEVRQQQRLRQQAIKQREREMAQEKEDEANRKRKVRRERERKAEEKARLEAMAAKVSTETGCADLRQMSRKKALRQARRMGRTKKVSH